MIAETQPTVFSKKNEQEHQLPGQYSLSVKKTPFDFEKIAVEYSLKRNNFNPNNPSPNLFINKLKKRFNCYYSS